jgi:hypothetical protein
VIWPKAQLLGGCPGYRLVTLLGIYLGNI